MAKKKTSNELRVRNSTTEFLTFAYQTGGDGVEVRVQDGMIWLSQKNMGQLFDTSSDNIGLHLKNILKDGELNAVSVTENFSVTAADGKNYTGDTLPPPKGASDHRLKQYRKQNLCNRILKV